MNYHRTYLDAPYSAITRSVKQPVARGHRAWLSVAQVGARRMAETAKHDSVRSTGDAVGDSRCAQPQEQS